MFEQLAARSQTKVNPRAVVLFSGRKKYFLRDEFSSAQYRICDSCNEKLLKDPNTSNQSSRTITVSSNTADENVDLGFEVRPERLSQATT